MQGKATAFSFRLRLHYKAALACGVSGKNMRIEDIHWHDSVILGVTLLPEKDTVHLHLLYPEDWETDSYADRTISFEDAYGYKELEGPFLGCPTILDANIVGSNEQWKLLRIETNAGYRELFFKEVALLDF